MALHGAVLRPLCGAAEGSSECHPAAGGGRTGRGTEGGTGGGERAGHKRDQSEDGRGLPRASSPWLVCSKSQPVQVPAAASFTLVAEGPSRDRQEAGTGRLA